MTMRIYPTWVIPHPICEITWTPWPQQRPHKLWTDRQMGRQSDYFRAPTFSCRALITALHLWKKTVKIISYSSLLQLENWPSQQGPREGWIHHQKHTRSRSYHQGPRSQDQNIMPICTYPSWVVQTHVAMLASVTLTQQRPQESQGQGHGSKDRGHRTKMSYQCTSTPHV